MTNHFTTKTMLSALGATSFLIAAPIGAVQLADAPSAVSAKAMERWQAETTAALGRALALSSAARLMAPNAAIVQVLFSIGSDGMAKDIEVLEGDGNWAARRAALYAVRTLDTLARVPVADPQGTRFIANIIFYRTLDARAQLLDKLQAMERFRLSGSSTARRYVAVGN